jgi:hypothetical protein
MTRFVLTQTQFNKWDNFCLDNGDLMYKNKDSYINEYCESSKNFIVHVFDDEQSGIINFLKSLVDA